MVWNEKPKEAIFLTQTHSTKIVFPNPPTKDEADGFIFSKDLKSPLAIKTADCMPIVLIGKRFDLFLHVGWKGLRDGILKAKEINEAQVFTGYVGPCIHQCCFEVTEEFKSYFPNSPHFNETSGKIHFDLIKEASDQLKISLKYSKDCTCCTDKYNSYRRNKTTQRNWNVLLKE